MRMLIRLSFALAALAAAPAAPAAVHSVGISVSPSQVVLLGAGSQAITVINPSDQPVTVDVSIDDYGIAAGGGFNVGARGAGGARSWLSVDSKHVVLAPGASAVVNVAASPPKNATPGDHHALLLLATRPGDRGQVGLSTRVGIPTLVRVAGQVVRRLELRGLRVGSYRGGRALIVGLANTGNLNERLLRGQVQVELSAGGRVLTRLQGLARDLLPGTTGTVTVPLPARLTGRMTATVRLRATPIALEGRGATPSPAPVVRSFTVAL